MGTAPTTTATIAAKSAETADSPPPDDWPIFTIRAEVRLITESEHITSAIRQYAESLAECAPQLPLGDLLNQRQDLLEIEQYLRVVDRRLGGHIEAARQALT